VAVESVRAVIQIRDVTGEHLLVITREMAFRKMQCVGKLDDLPQKIGPRSEAFDDARNLASSRSDTPEVVSCCSVAGGFLVFDDFDLGLRHRQT